MFEISVIRRVSLLTFFVVFLTSGSAISSAYGQGDTSACIRLAYDQRVQPFLPQYQAFFQTLYGKIGHCIQSLEITSTRKEMLLATGELDGDWLRVSEFAERNKEHVIALPQATLEIPVYFLWSMASDFDGTPGDLKTRKIGYTKGLRWVEWNLERRQANALGLTSESNVWNLLTRGRIDVYATSNAGAVSLMADAKARGIPFRSAIWDYVPMHHILHKKHKDLVPSLNAAMGNMIKSGEAAAILAIPHSRVAPFNPSANPETP